MTFKFSIFHRLTIYDIHQARLRPIKFMNSTFDSSAIRNQFPSLQRKHNGKPLVFIDGPAGTQVPQVVIDGITHYYANSNANTHGSFVTTNETDKVIEGMRNAMAALLGAENARTIS